MAGPKTLPTRLDLLNDADFVALKTLSSAEDAPTYGVIVWMQREHRYFISTTALFLETETPYQSFMERQMRFVSRVSNRVFRGTIRRLDLFICICLRHD